MLVVSQLGYRFPVPRCGASTVSVLFSSRPRTTRHDHERTPHSSQQRRKPAPPTCSSGWLLYRISLRTQSFGQHFRQGWPSTRTVNHSTTAVAKRKESTRGIILLGPFASSPLHTAQTKARTLRFVSLKSFHLKKISGLVVSLQTGTLRRPAAPPRLHASSPDDAERPPKAHAPTRPCASQHQPTPAHTAKKPLEKNKTSQSLLFVPCVWVKDR